MSRILRLTLLAPDIVEAILDGRQAPEMMLPVLMKGLSVGWDQQKVSWFTDHRRTHNPHQALAD